MRFGRIAGTVDPQPLKVAQPSILVPELDKAAGRAHALRMDGKTIKHGFTGEQLAWLKAQFSAATSNTGFDKATIKWMIGGLAALGVAAFGVLYAELGSVRGEVGSVRSEVGSIRSEVGSIRSEVGSVRSEVGSVRSEVGSVQGEVSNVRDQVQVNTAALARLEAKVDALATDVSEIRNGQSKIIDLLLEGRN